MSSLPTDDAAPAQRQSPAGKPISDLLLALAPANLSYKRATRYVGDTISADLTEFAAEDQTTTRRAYDFLERFLALLAPYPVDESRWSAIEIVAHDPAANELVEAMQHLGEATRRDFPTHTAAAKAIHDLRGGGLTAILGRLQIIALGLERPGSSSRRPGELNSFFILARDHLKITRNAITGLDDQKRDGDRASKFHHIDLVVDKWRNAIPGPATGSLSVEVDSRFSGNMSECCLESAAIDRICYNLVNNACRHCSAGPIKIDILLMPGAPLGHLRFVVSNRIDDVDEAKLSALTEGVLSRLFMPGVSSTGSGIGLAIVADFVAQAFGLPDSQEAITQSYVGARVEGGWFHAWFHWPAARNAAPSPENML